MKIVRCEWVAMPLPLERPYRIAYETVDEVTNVFVQLVTDTAHVGLGCAAPDAAVTGETLAVCTAAVVASAEPVVGHDALDRLAILEALAPTLVGAPAAEAAIDMALHDLLGKAAGLPVCTLLGGYRRSIATSVTLGIDSLEAMVAEARVHASRGFRAIKLKGGIDVDHDIAMVRAVRHALGPDIEIRFDANQGYSAEVALRFLDGSAGCGVSVLEQPTPRGARNALREVTTSTSIRVMADESLVDLADALHLAAGERADLVNIKLMKVGGLDKAVAVNAVVRSAGLEVMVGCMDESELAISAGLHFALSRPNVEMADLDGHLELLSDPGRGAVRLEQGVMTPADAPGLGLARLPCFE